MRAVTPSRHGRARAHGPRAWACAKRRPEGETLRPASEEMPPVAGASVDVEVVVRKGLPSPRNLHRQIIARGEIGKHAQEIVGRLDVKGHIVLPRQKRAVVVLDIVALLLEDERVGEQQRLQPVRERVAVEVQQEASIKEGSIKTKRMSLFPGTLVEGSTKAGAKNGTPRRVLKVGQRRLSMLSVSTASTDEVAVVAWDDLSLGGPLGNGGRVGSL